MQIEPYIAFGGNCQEALDFYASALGGKIVELHRWGGSAMDDGKLPPEWRDKVMHATFDAEGARFMASDGGPGKPAPQHCGISLSVNVPKDVDKARRVFNALAEGGQVTMPFDKTFWGAMFGMLTDKFGIAWMVNSDM